MSDPVPVRLNGRELSAPHGRSLLFAILDAGQPIATACGGEGRCHLCRVEITAGREHLPPANAIEDKALGNVLVSMGWRLACQVRVETPLSVTVPEVRKKRSAWPARLPTPTASTPPANESPGEPPHRRRRRGGRR